MKLATVAWSTPRLTAESIGDHRTTSVENRNEITVPPNTDSDFSDTDSASSEDQLAQRTNKRKSMDPAPPKMSTFDGEVKTWRAFKIQFREYSRIYQWSTQTRLSNGQLERKGAVVHRQKGKV